MLPRALGGLKRLRAADPEPPCAREYVKDHISRELPLGTSLLYQKSARMGGENHRNSLKFSGVSGTFGNASTIGFKAISSFGKSSQTAFHTILRSILA